jgi:hypothetical protein
MDSPMMRVCVATPPDDSPGRRIAPGNLPGKSRRHNDFLAAAHSRSSLHRSSRSIRNRLE